MKRRMRKRILSAVLSAAMLLSSTPVYADVVVETADPEVGLCEHHTEHEDWCGYIAPTPGIPCAHEHEENCYSEVLTCGLEEDVIATDGNSAHVHDDGCYESEVDCQHVHDDECGYVEASAGAECEFTCAECITLEELGGEGEGMSPWVINDRFTFEDDGVTYTCKEIGPGEAQIYAIENIPSTGILVIPQNVQDVSKDKEYVVTSIYGDVFTENEEVISVEFKAPIVEIDAEMFKGCINLETVKLPNTVTVIGDSAFEGCTNLTSINLEKILEIGGYAFANCYNLDAAFLNSIENCPQCKNEVIYFTASNALSGEVCADCADEAVYISNSVTDIGRNAFLLEDDIFSRDIVTSCEMDVKDEVVYKLISASSFGWGYIIGIFPGYGNYFLNMPSEELGYFEVEDRYCVYKYRILMEQSGNNLGMAELYSVTLNDNGYYSPYIKIDSNECIDSDKDGEYEYEVIGFADDFEIDLDGIDYDVVIPNTFEYVGRNAFKNETHLYQVRNCSDELEIRDHAFEGCKNLNYFGKPNYASLSLESVYQSITGLDINASIKSLGDRAFAGCDQFEQIKVSSPYVEMGNEVFAECDNLQYASFEEYSEASLYSGETERMEAIPSGMFKDCKKLELVKIPYNFTSIGASAFENCKNFESLFAEGMDDDFGNPLKYTIPNNIQVIGSRAFLGCRMWKNVFASEYIISVGDSVFNKGTNFVTDSSQVQLMLVESMDNSEVPDTSWDGKAEVDENREPLYGVMPGAIVTVDDGASIGDDTDSRGGIIGEEAQVTIKSGTTVEVPEDKVLTLEEDSILYVYGTLYLDGTICGPDSGTATICVPDLGNVVFGEKADLGDNLKLRTNLTSSMIAIDHDGPEATLDEGELKVSVSFGGRIFEYSAGENKDYTYSYPDTNPTYGTAKVVVTPTLNGNLLGRSRTKNFTIGKATPTVAVGQTTVDKAKVTVTATVSGGVGSGYDGTMTIQVLQDGKVKLVKNIQMDGSSTSVDYTWNNLYNGEYTVKAIYNGDRYHTSAASTEAVEFTISVSGNNAPLGTGGSGGSGTGGSGGGGGGENSGQTPAIPNPNPNNSEPIDYGVITLDPVKGYVSSNYGILARNSQEKHSAWKVDEISALIWGGNVNDYWQLQYPNGSVAKGSKSVDQNGNPIEKYLWEQVNGKWWIFDSNGYAKMGWVYDPNYQAWFYIDVKNGMRIGWVQVNNLWYYLHEVSDGRKGCMYAATRTPDGYYVNADGAWDGKAKQ